MSLRCLIGWHSWERMLVPFQHVLVGGTMTPVRVCRRCGKTQYDVRGIWHNLTGVETEIPGQHLRDLDGGVGHASRGGRPSEGV